MLTFDDFIKKSKSGRQRKISGRRGVRGMKRNAETGFFTTPSPLSVVWNAGRAGSSGEKQPGRRHRPAIPEGSNFRGFKSTGTLQSAVKYIITGNQNAQTRF